MNSKLQNKCPDYEDVSAFLDGELAPSSPEFKHIESCEECQERLGKYRKVNQSISDEFKVAVPGNFTADLIANIKARQEKQNNKPKPKPLPFHMFMKVAAILVICGIALFVIKKEETQQPFDPVNAEPLVFLNQPVPPKNISELKFPPSRDHAIAGSDSIDIRDLMNVSSGNLKNSDFFNIEDPKDCVACIQSKVSQAWSVDNLSNAENEFAKFAENTKFTKDMNGNAVATLILTKKELAELVRKCKLSGFRLLSPSQPQPEQITFSGNPDEKVSYSVKLIQSE